MSEDLVERLAQTPARLQAIVAGLPAEAWTRVPPGAEATGSWSLASLARHLRDIELDAFHFRIEQILSQSPPQWERRFSGFISPERGEDGPAALAEFVRARAATVARLRDLSPDQWAMAAEHPRRGPLDLHYFARAYLDHDQEHLDQARRLVEWLATSRP